jgi:hypothetical protein
MLAPKVGGEIACRGACQRYLLAAARHTSVTNRAFSNIVLRACVLIYDVEQVKLRFEQEGWHMWHVELGTPGYGDDDGPFFANELDLEWCHWWT